MKKTRLRLFEYCYAPCACTFFLFAQKSVYIPGDFNNSWADDYCNKNGKMEQSRVLMTWRTPPNDGARPDLTRRIMSAVSGSRIGTDPTKLVDPSNTSSTFNLLPVLGFAKNHCPPCGFTASDLAGRRQPEKVQNTLYAGLYHQLGGNGRRLRQHHWRNVGQPAAVGINSQAIYPYYTLSRMRCSTPFSYQCGADKPSSDYRSCNDANNGPFWERSANHAAADMYPNVNQDLARYMYATQTHYLHPQALYHLIPAAEHGGGIRQTGTGQHLEIQ